MTVKTKYWLLIFLILATAISTTNFFNWSMAVLTTFVLAYLTKGSRVS